MEIIDYFLEISKVPRCSKNKEPFINFFRLVAQKYGYDIQIDNAGNILCKKNNPTICLQAHYDMVCIGDTDSINIISKDGYLMAKNSTLGADNGIAIAYIIKLMEMQKDIEILLTSDEEIGLIGANNLSLDIKSKYILNIDTEEEGSVYIGCAGGVDVIAQKRLTTQNKEPNHIAYKLMVYDLMGGHSGVDIDKNIPNAIKLATNEIMKIDDAKIVSIDGGERTNSIPKNTTIVFYSHHQLQSYKTKNISLEKISCDDMYMTDNIPNILNTIHTGVIEYNNDLNCVNTSQNLAIVSTKNNTIQIIISQRSMDNDELSKIEKYEQSHLQSLGFDVECVEKYPSWKPQISEFTTFVQNEYKKYYDDVSIKSVHAGLECSILLAKYPTIQIASIGPNIYNPHSISERVEVLSLYRVFDVVCSIVDNIKDTK